MNIFRTNFSSFFCFDENNSGAAGGTTPAPAASPGAPAPASSTPAPTPTPEPSPSPSPAADADPFAGMDSDDGFDAIDLGAAAEPSPEPAQPAASPAATPAPAAPAAPAAPSPAAPAAASPAPAPAGNEQASPRSPLEETIEGFTKNAAELANWSAQNVFALSKEETEALEVDAARTTCSAISFPR